MTVANFRSQNKDSAHKFIWNFIILLVLLSMPVMVGVCGYGVSDYMAMMNNTFLIMTGNLRLPAITMTIQIIMILICILQVGLMMILC